MPTIVAAFDRIRKGLPVLSPKADLNHAANFLYMLNGEVPDAQVTRLMDVYLCFMLSMALMRVPLPVESLGLLPILTQLSQALWAHFQDRFTVGRMSEFCTCSAPFQVREKQLHFSIK